MRFIVAICLYLFSTAAFAKRLAVLDFGSVNVDKAVIAVMAEMVRNTAANQLAPSGVKVMDKANMLSLLQDQGKDARCISGQCEIDLGRNIGADFVVTGQLTVIDGDWILNLSLYETLGGTKLKGQTIEKPSGKALRRALSDETRLLLSALKKRRGPMGSFQEGFGTQNDEDDWNPGAQNLVTVRFDSQPTGAAVLLDGEMICETPCSQQVGEGAHRVLFSKKRHRSVTRDLMARNGESLSVRLDPKYGWFSVRSKPSGIALKLDGKPIGKTPINKREIDPGIHRLKVNDPCFKPLDYRFQTKAAEHKTDIPTLPLKHRQSAIQVSAWSGKDSVLGTVYVDGQRQGQTGRVIKVPLCSKTVEVRTKKGQRWSQKLSLKEKKLSKITAKLNGGGGGGGGVQSSKLGVKTVYIAPGTFTMGSPESEEGRLSDETQHKVRLTRGFHMMQSEVTQGLYQQVMGKNPSWFRSCGSNCPVEKVSWFDMVRFANAISKAEGLEECYQLSGDKVLWPKGYDCKGWRLPTEAEWEYAAKGGESFKYAGSDDLKEIAWYSESKHKREVANPVCKKKKNGYGLCDMSGNVWEWVWDWYGDYPTSAVSNPTGPSSASGRVNRGGGWDGRAVDARVAFRDRRTPSIVFNYIGARLLRSAEQ